MIHRWILFLLLTSAISVANAQSLVVRKTKARGDTLVIRMDHILGITTDSSYYYGRVIELTDSAITIKAQLERYRIEYDSVVIVPMKKVIAIQYCPHDSIKSCIKKPSVIFYVGTILAGMVAGGYVYALLYPSPVAWFAGFLVGELGWSWPDIREILWGPNTCKFYKNWRIVDVIP